MTIVEKNNLDNTWLFRTQPLQTGHTTSMREVSLELARIPTPVPVMGHNYSAAAAHGQQHQQQRQHQQPTQVQAAALYAQQNQQQGFPHNDNVRHRPPPGPGPTDPKKVVKSSTAPNLPTSNSLSEMFRVI